VFGLTLAACCADALVMALGHVWTTYVSVTAHSQERTSARALFDSSRADAKGQLVDYLLGKGMLKIDAMSLVDTLEGYPDVFVSVWLGDPIANGVNNGDQHGTETVRGHDETTVAFGPPLFVGVDVHDPDMLDHQISSISDNPEGTAGLRTQSRQRYPSRTIPSWRQINDSWDGRWNSPNNLDPEIKLVHETVQESAHEALFMLLGFSMFSLIPSVLLWIIPPTSEVDRDQHSRFLNVDGNHVPVSSSLDESPIEQSPLVSSTTLLVISTSLVAWLLGVWKSRFVSNGHRIAFGLESVVLLLVCGMAAFGIGYLLRFMTESLTISI
jgi:hypothetical protein